MLTEILLWICIILLLFLSYKYAVSRPEGFPPGPPRIPLFGSYLFMMLSDFKYMHKAVLKLSKWYKTDILGFHMGPYPVVAAHNQQAIREILFNQDFDGRPELYLAAMRDPDLKIEGIFFRDGPIWKEQRRFILRQLRDFGFGRRFTKLEQVIQEEIDGLLDLIRNGPRYEHEKEFVKSNGYRTLLPITFNIPSANSMFYVSQGIRYPRSEQAVIYELTKHIMAFQRHTDDYGKMISIMPWIRHIFPKWSSYDQLMECNRFIHKFFSNIVDQHIDTYDENYERNFIDVYIKKWKAKEKDMKDGSNISFNRNQLVLAMIDFHFPAATGIGIQISFLIQHLLLQPNILKRIQREIDEVVGFGRLPTLDDRKYLHYTEATIREIMRIETLVPSDVPHLAMVDTELLGYKVPKNTVVIPSLYAFHNDKRDWVDPENFRPDRFLDENGHLSLKLDITLPFGAGKRLCPGETFARNMLFLLVASLCQNFNFTLGPEDKLPDLSKTLSGLTTTPPNFWLQLEERK